MSESTTIPGTETVKKIYTEAAERTGALLEELGKGHGRWIEYGNTQIDELSDVLKNQFNYVNDIAASWRKLGVDSFKRTLEVFSK